MESWIIALIVIVFLFACLILFWSGKKQHTNNNIPYVQQLGKETVKHSFPENIKREDYLKWVQNAVFNSRSVKDVLRGN